MSAYAPQIVDASLLKPADYNPRKSDERRLSFVQLSLRSLGWLLPIFAKADGTILSGHQRYKVWVHRMGRTQVPVQYFDTAGYSEIGLNIIFNAATNDIDLTAGWAGMRDSVVDYFKDFDVETGLPDAADPWPCMSAKMMNVAELLNGAGNETNTKPFMAGKYAANAGIEMPVILTRRGRKVVNGFGRLMAAVHRGVKEIPTVEIDDELEPTAKKLLNSLSMDFTVGEGAVADTLRFGSFRRSRSRRSQQLGSAYTMSMGFYNIQEFHFDEPTHRKLFAEVNGRSLCDFGAGHDTEGKLLRSAGFSVASFEPYFVPEGLGDTVDIEKSKAMTRRFLKEIESGKMFDTVFSSWVFNSIPFHADREHVAALLAALCWPDGVLCVATWTPLTGPMQDATNSSGGRVIASIPLPYEKNVTVGDFKLNPKVQKGFTQKDIIDLLSPHFQTVHIESKADLVVMFLRCRGPKVSWAKVEAAIEFEFDLPYKDGSRMGLVDMAKRAFRNRLDKIGFLFEGHE